jgi:hypothetical protein
MDIAFACSVTDSVLRSCHASSPSPLQSPTSLPLDPGQALASSAVLSADPHLRCRLFHLLAACRLDVPIEQSAASHHRHVPAWAEKREQPTERRQLRLWLVIKEETGLIWNHWESNYIRRRHALFGIIRTRLLPSYTWSIRIYQQQMIGRRTHKRTMCKSLPQEFRRPKGKRRHGWDGWAISPNVLIYVMMFALGSIKIAPRVEVPFKSGWHLISQLQSLLQKTTIATRDKSL